MNKGITLKEAVYIAKRFIKLVEHHTTKIEITGAIRRQCKNIRQVDILCVEKQSNKICNVLDKTYKGLLIDGKRLKRVEYQGITVNIYITTREDFGRMMAIYTGSSSFVHLKISTIWNKKGWVVTENGLRLKQECRKYGRKWVIKENYIEKHTVAPAFYTEFDFFSFLGINLILPQERNWTHNKGTLNIK